MDVGIIGAGATGLSAAYRLSKKGHKITIFEAEDYTGGIASAVETAGSRLERFYHHIFTVDSEIIELIRELNLTEKLKWYRPKNAIFSDGRLHPFTTPLDLARYPVIPLLQRLRLGLLVLKAGRLNNWTELEGTSAEEWITKQAGDKAYARLWGPLLESKFDNDADRVSAVWIWNKLKLRGASRGRDISSEMLGYMDGSFAVLYDELTDRIKNMGGCVLTSHRVDSLAPEESGRIRIMTSGGKHVFDKVLVTVSPEILLRIAGDCLPAGYRNRLGKISYKANICAVLELTKPLSRYYWITVAERGFPFVLLMEHTSLVSARNYKSHIVYLSRYLDAGNPLYNADDKAVADTFADGVSTIFPSFRPADVKDIHIYRARYAQPVITMNYQDVIPPVATPLKNLYHACMAQIYPEDRGQNHAIRMGREAAILMDRELKNKMI